jgi:hypothetical protein
MGALPELPAQLVAGLPWMALFVGVAVLLVATVYVALALSCAWLARRCEADPDRPEKEALHRLRTVPVSLPAARRR